MRLPPSITLSLIAVLGFSSAGHAALVTDIQRNQPVTANAVNGQIRVADADNFYTFDYSDDATFEQGQQRYQSDNGYITNFDAELLPLLPIEQDGGVYLRSETVETPGTGLLQDGRTSLQIDFNF